MLKSLHVKNLAVLAGGEVELGDGFNVLTGETGAGKSLVVDSLALLGGARAASELVREGAESLIVSGVFELPPRGACPPRGGGPGVRRRRAGGAARDRTRGQESGLPQ